MRSKSQKYWCASIFDFAGAGVMRMAQRGVVKSIAGTAALIVVVAAAVAAPPAHRPQRATPAALQQTNAEVTAARVKHASLQAEVTRLEQQNAARQRQLQQRDAQIAALQQEVAARGATSASPAFGKR